MDGLKSIRFYATPDQATLKMWITR